jgi:hypothetical protein
MDGSQPDHFLLDLASLDFRNRMPVSPFIKGGSPNRLLIWLGLDRQLNPSQRTGSIFHIIQATGFTQYFVSRNGRKLLNIVLLCSASFGNLADCPISPRDGASFFARLGNAGNRLQLNSRPLSEIVLSR